MSNSRVVDPPIKGLSFANHERSIPRRYHGMYRRAASGKSRKTAIRCFCLECVAWQEREVGLCSDLRCPLYPYRLTG